MCLRKFDIFGYIYLFDDFACLLKSGGGGVKAAAQRNFLSASSISAVVENIFSPSSDFLNCALVSLWGAV